MFEVTAPRSTARFADQMAFLHHDRACFGPEIASAAHSEREHHWASEAVRRRRAEELASNLHWLDELPWHTA